LCYNATVARIVGDLAWQNGNAIENPHDFPDVQRLMQRLEARVQARSTGVPTAAARAIWDSSHKP
jgi:hypothetical protein